MNQSQKVLEAYAKAINKIDDYFEYRNESKVDRDFVHVVLAKLEADIRKVIGKDGE